MMQKLVGFGKETGNAVPTKIKTDARMQLS
jgi:hypothetical protein